MVRLQSLDKIIKIGLNESVFYIFDVLSRTDVKYILVVDGTKYAGLIYRSLFIRKYSVKNFESDDTVISSGIYREHIACFTADGTVRDTRKQAIQYLKDNKGLIVIPVLDQRTNVVGLWENDLQDDLLNRVDFFQKYSYCQLNGYSIYRFCKEKGFKNIVMIGGGPMAVVLFNDLQQGSDVEIISILDHEHRSLGKLNTLTWGEGKKAFREADVSIITYLDNEKVLEYTARESGATCVYTLNDLIDEIYDRVVILERLKALSEQMFEEGIELYLVAYPRAMCIKDKSEWERILCDNAVEAVTLREEFEKYKNFLMTAFHNEYEFDVIDKAFIHAPLSQRLYHGYHIQNDMKTEYINIVCGKRVTVNSCLGAEKRIHVFGKSWAFSKYSEDKQTLCSNLQKLCVDNGYRVLNYGVCGLPIEQVVSMLSDNIKGMNSGDKVILIYNDDEKKELKLIKSLSKEGIPVIDGEIIVQRPHEYGELYIDRSHLNQFGERLLAGQIYETIFKIEKPYKKIESLSSYRECYITTPITITEDEYRLEKEILNYLETVKTDLNGSRIGCIVMNCNPFTLGHKYLIESAAKYVDVLYVFVVMEDKSVFPFEHRFEMVKKGCSELKNVVVVPSGKFMISDITFPEYFEKEKKNNIFIDATNDLKLFCENIAPFLGIKTRFAGTEPHDMVTCQYNDFMRQILPLYNIDFVEIERKEIDSDVISASRVRKLLKERNLEAVCNFVPKTTFEYLQDNLDEIIKRMERK